MSWSQRVIRHKFELLMGLLLLIGFGVRLSFMAGGVYHIDEFITLLAASMVAQRGLPILPSGLFYDHGLLFSLISGAFVAMLGFKEAVARWPSILMGVLTIAVYYPVGRRLFGWRTAGLLAAALVTLDQSAIMWSARARMYTEAHLFVLLTLALLLDSTLNRPGERRRYLFLLALAAALFSHTVTFLILPPLGITLLVFTLTYRFDWLRQPRLWLQAIVAALILGGALWIVSMGQTGSTVSLQDPNAAAAAPLGLDFLRGFFAPAFSSDGFDDLLDFFKSTQYYWLLPLIGLWLPVPLYRWVRRRAEFRDIAFLFLTLFIVLVVVEQGTLLTGNWQKARYLFMTVLPAFYLLGAESLGRWLHWLIGLLGRWSPALAPKIRAASPVALAGLAIIAALWGADAWGIAHAQGTGNYNDAFEYVRRNLQPGDKIMTIHPSAAYLYAGQSDYYANQVSAKVIEEGDEVSALDRYVGSPLVDSVDSLNAVLASGVRVWFVVDRSRLYRRYDTLFTQQIFAQMDHVFSIGGVDIFLSRLFPAPLPAEPPAALDGNFGGQILLAGYGLNPATLSPDGVLPLALYWRLTLDSPPAAGSMPKVFVQLRDGQGQTIAQADHFFYEGLLTLDAWKNLKKENDWLRDSADLPLPLPLSPDNGPYRIYVGLYNPATLERVPLLNDTSGENAVVIEFSSPQP